MTSKNVFILCAMLFMFWGCKEKYPDLEDGLYAEIVTDKGTMIAELYFEKTPVTVGSFVSLAEGTSEAVDSTYKGKHFYNGLSFHRIIKDFMIQGGDPDGNGSGGPGYKFFDELRPDLRHDTIGILSMANSGYGTNGSQFFITHKPTPHLDGYDMEGNLKNCENPRTGCHTVFGKVVKGFETLNTIANVEVPNPQDGKPANPVTIEEINIIRKGGAARRFDAAKTFREGMDAKKKEEAKAAQEQTSRMEEMSSGFEEKRKEATILDSGLGILKTTTGDGDQPKLGQTVLVDYAGYFEDGQLFDSNSKVIADKWNMQTRPSIEKYAPYEVVYGPEASMIAGFKEGLQQMKVGDKATLFIPYHLGYGERGYAIIPPKTDLVFEVEILGIK
ncbi:peptidylprolyl isomerase [Flavimarina sp. Hel_I_48]|uniref:peptidylprolyl isomerase n=1 Tax=Flavimarina sp. Hel_I_48 TaxID=1392488 RepID=UPI0004DFCC85|nr:peptidylprolyl isomerase [Flavimarina sp. Hel_I_48]